MQGSAYLTDLRTRSTNRPSRSVRSKDAFFDSSPSSSLPFASPAVDRVAKVRAAAEGSFTESCHRQPACSRRIALPAVLPRSIGATQLFYTSRRSVGPSNFSGRIWQAGARIRSGIDGGVSAPTPRGLAVAAPRSGHPRRHRAARQRTSRQRPSARRPAPSSR